MHTVVLNNYIKMHDFLWFQFFFYTLLAKFSMEKNNLIMKCAHAKKKLAFLNLVSCSRFVTQHKCILFLRISRCQKCFFLPKIHFTNANRKQAVNRKHSITVLVLLCSTSRQYCSVPCQLAAQNHHVAGNYIFWHQVVSCLNRHWWIPCTANRSLVWEGYGSNMVM